MAGAVQLDQGCYCEPVMCLNAYKKWISLTSKAQVKWADQAGLKIDAMKRLEMSVKDLLDKTQKAICVANSPGFYDEEDGNKEDELEFDSGHLDLSVLDPDYVTSQKELNYFRLILTWISTENIIMQKSIKATDKKPPFQSVLTIPIACKAIRRRFAPVNLISTRRGQKCDGMSYSIPLEIKSEGKQRTIRYCLRLPYSRCLPDVSCHALQRSYRVCLAGLSLSLQCRWSPATSLSFINI